MQANTERPKEAYIAPASKTQVPDWELPPGESTTRSHRLPFRGATSGAGNRFSGIFGRNRYFGLKRKTFFIALGVSLLLLLALIIGLGVGLSRKGSKAQNLPLPTNKEAHEGDLTYYAPGLGACGGTSSDTDDIVSISHFVFDAASTGSNPNANPLCGKKIRVRRFNEDAGAERSVDLTVVDRCTGCKPTDVDVSPGVFDKLAPRDKGRVVVTWAWL